MKQFIRYFKQLYRECFVPVLREDGKEVFSNGLIYNLAEVTELDCQILFADDKVHDRHYKYYLEHGDDMSDEAISNLFVFKARVQNCRCPEILSTPLSLDAQECPAIAHN